MVCKNRRSKTSNDVSIQALSGLVNFQKMMMSTIDHALEEIILEGLLLELPKTWNDASVLRSRMTFPQLVILLGEK